jgi:uncharacterized protein (DUF488 family)
MSAAAGGCTVHTIGHSTRTLEEFAFLLTEAAVRVVVDVRALPRSRKNPQFNIEALPTSLAHFGMDYRHLPELGGRRHRPPGAPPSLNAFWRNDSFRNYADYALTSEFAAGLDALRNLATSSRCAVMCSEAVWWRCHRRIIADYLLAGGFTVLHILGARAVQVAELTSGATRLPDGRLLYPKDDGAIACDAVSI